MENANNQTEPKENELSILPVGGHFMASNDQKQIKEFRLRCQAFAEQMNRLPAESAIVQTSDKKALTVAISHVQTTLDEYFFGLWETKNFRWQTHGNKVMGCLDLVVTNPVTGLTIMRQGAAAVNITKDQVPDIMNTSTDIKTEEDDELELGFPALISLCTKNAAKSLGKMFGRDLNRTITDNFQGLLKQPAISPNAEVTQEMRDLIEAKTDPIELDDMYENNPHLHANSEFFKQIINKKSTLR